MDKTERFNKAYNYLKYIGKVKKQEDVADAMKSTRSNVSRALNGDPAVLTESFLQRFSRAYSEFNSNWVVYGEGEMLKGGDLVDQMTKRWAKKLGASKEDNSEDAGPRIPLVEQNAVAGWGNSAVAIAETDIKEYYIIPKFRHLQVDFMIEVTGDSMQPSYHSGDVVACRIIRSSYIQWNRCHVIATRDQGILIKRLQPSEKPEHIQAVSDNPRYPPFDVPLSDVESLAMVVGSIHVD